MLKLPAMRGYILEELLAYLIQNTGYHLLVDVRQDPHELSRRGNGLVVQGRGGMHQADVLGQLSWIPAFTHPIRLFVEAKFRDSKTGLTEVRNAVGLINDINQNYSPIRTNPQSSRLLMKRYTYKYALFSTSGFSAPAVDYAMAHQISLIDLSGPGFSDLRRLTTDLADRIYGNELSNQPRIFKVIRLKIRQLLNTWPNEVNFPNNVFEDVDITENIIDDLLGDLVNRIQGIDQFVVGMAEGPFLLVFKPDDYQRFVNYSLENLTHRVNINWLTQDNQERQWHITPQMAEGDRRYRLSFSLPSAIADWVFQEGAIATNRALHAKEEYFANISIYFQHENTHRIIRLEYQPQEFGAER